jgi:hypothetical protein
MSRARPSIRAWAVTARSSRTAKLAARLPPAIGEKAPAVRIAIPSTAIPESDPAASVMSGVITGVGVKVSVAARPSRRPAPVVV